MELVQIEKLAEMLRKKRKRADVKQKMVANRAGLSPSQVNRIENNTVNPSYESVYKLWKALERVEDQDVQIAEDLMNEPIKWARPDETLEDASKKMRQNNFSQLPVKSKEEGVSAGRITEGRIMEVGQPDMKVREAMSSKFLEVVPTTSIDIVKEILKEDPALMVQEEKSSDYVGIITKTDLL